MGKYKQKKRDRRSNPTSLLSMEECQAMEEEDAVHSHPVSGTVTSLVEKLQHAHAEERELGCTAIAGLVGEPGAVPQLMRSNVIRIMGPLIIDPAPSVRKAALGALRNVSVDGGESICTQMVQQDLMTPLTAFFNQYGNNWQPESIAAKKLDKDEKYSSFLQAVNLLWNLCEASETAVEIFNRERLLLMLLPCLNVEQYGLELSVAVGQCILTASENNTDACSLLSQEDMLSALLDITKSPHTTMLQVLFKTTITGVLFNCLSCDAVNTDLLDHLTQALNCVLQENLVQALQATLQAISDTKPANQDAASTEEDSCLSQEVSAMLSEVSSLCSADQMALEMLSNLCDLGADDEGDWEDVDSGGDSTDDAMDTEAEQSMDNDTDSDLLERVKESLKKCGVVSNVISLVTNVCQFDISAFGTHSGLKKLNHCVLDLRKTGLLSINNLVTSLDSELLGSASSLNVLWQQLSKMSIQSSVQSDVELLESTTCALRAVAQKLAVEDDSILGQTTQEDIQIVCDLVSNSSSSTVQANAIRIAATIGMVLAKNNPTHHLLKIIGEFLYECSASDLELWVIAESLDSIFDVFAQDETDAVLKDSQIVPKLQALVPVLKQKVIQQKGRLGEYLPVISTARTNLVRFIKYKSKRL